jgi:hypothetical protein
MDVCCEGCSKIDTISAEIELGVAALELGVLRERERIIALLEESRFYLVDGVLQPTAFINISDAIALIKGENK